VLTTGPQGRRRSSDRIQRSRRRCRRSQTDVTRPRESWIACRPGFFLPVRVLSRMFRGLFLHYLEKADQ
jgi:hypothetical protein